MPTVVWPYFVIAADLVIASVASAHAMLRKRDVRAAIGWVGLIWLAPLVGALLYVVLGINRVQRRAMALRTRRRPGDCRADGESSALAAQLDAAAEHLRDHVRLVGNLVRAPLVGGNRIEPLDDGAVAYDAMLAAIDGARQSVALATYIFDDDPSGRRFVTALQAAVRRGCAVRVLIDGIGARYSRPRITGALRAAGVPHALFLPGLVPGRLRFANLRNHRKILVADGRTAFTGGMNIRHGHTPDSPQPHQVRDLHFRVSGPVASQLQAVFTGDWAFATGEALDGPLWFPEPAASEPLPGGVLARAIPDGPDEQIDTLRLVLLGAIAAARRSIHIATPYFLPDLPLIQALKVAALRGVAVHILLPERGNIPLVRWAAMAQLWQVLEGGCRVWLSPPPFDHTKLMLVDGLWATFGSVNWDPRSLRLNFECNVEAYDAALVGRLQELTSQRIAAARETSLAEVDGRSLPIRLRDAAARLFSPYL